MLRWDYCSGENFPNIREALIWHNIDTGKDICETCFEVDIVQAGSNDLGNTWRQQVLRPVRIR